MIFATRKFIEDEVMKDLMFAHRRIAKEGDSKQMMKLSRFILRLAKKRKNDLFELGCKKDNKYTDEPPDESEENVT